MPTVDVGKCSAAVLEKDFWRERMRSALEDSRGCCWAPEAVWYVCQLDEPLESSKDCLSVPV